ncbi:MAG: hypothetical protein LBD20_01415 [Spirochaetaceae bacterium]|jgi:hypothetical protein|nr:hypothetical protein [Spirochaetaceae bacterium]
MGLIIKRVRQLMRGGLAGFIVISGLLMPTAAFGQNFKPFTALRTVKTEHFEFIYPIESEETARYLAGRADAIYKRLSALFGINLGGRIPVTITPHTDEVNGYMNPVPYSHILVFDTPEFIDFTLFENTLENLFIHELTHAVTAGSKGPVVKAMHTVFGGWANLLAFNAPWFMIEGAAVMVESENGFGRANDPLVKEKLRQDILEGAFKTPFQAEGVWDLPPGANTYYNYGGLFCEYLVTTYGYAKFAELWQKIGSTFHFSFAKYNNGFYYIFKKVYGKHILDAWREFENDIAVKDAVDENPHVVYKKRGNNANIADVVSFGKKVYFLDKHAAKVFVYDTVTKKTKTAAAVDSAAYGIDVSPDGTRLLVSTYIRAGANPGQLSRAVAAEYKTKSGLPTGRVFKKIYSARYFRDGILGIASDTHKTNVVYRSFEKKAVDEVLLRGSRELIFGNISPLDRNRFAFVYAVKGRRMIGFFDYEQKTAAAATAKDDKDGHDYWNYTRGLRYSGGRLMFEYNDDDRFSKLGVIDFDADGGMSARLYRADVSGGLHNPVWADGGIFYKSAFSQTDALSRYSGLPAVSGGASGGSGGGGGFTAVPLKLKPWSASLLAESGLAKEAAAGGHGAQEGGGVEGGGGEAVMRQWTDYRNVAVAAKYFNPFNLWLPLPYLRGETSGTPLSFSGLGGFFYISDPFDSNLIFLEAYYDWEYTMIPINLTWINYSFGLPIYIYYKDYVVPNDFSPRRISEPYIYLYFQFPIFNNRLTLNINPGVSATYIFYGQGTALRGGKSVEPAYSWEKTSTDRYFFNLEVILSNIMRHKWQIFGNGLSEGFYMHTWLFTGDKPSFENVITAVLEPLPLIHLFGIKQTLYGAYWERNLLNIQGISLMQKTKFNDVSLTDYSYRLKMRPKWIAGGETEVKLFSVEAQKSFSHLYFNRAYTTLAYRWGYWADQGGEYTAPFLHSVILRFGMDYSVTPVSVVPITLRPLFWMSLKLSALDGTVDEAPFLFGISFSYTY